MTNTKDTTTIKRAKAMEWNTITSGILVAVLSITITASGMLSNFSHKIGAYEANQANLKEQIAKLEDKKLDKAVFEVVMKKLDAFIESNKIINKNNREDYKEIVRMISGSKEK